MNLSGREKKLLSILIFLIKFLILAIPLYLISLLNLFPFQLLTAQLSILISKFIGIPTTLVIERTPAILISNIKLIIDSACTGYRSIIAFASLVLASPKKRKEKLRAFLFLPFIYSLNVLRISFLSIWAFLIGNNFFEFVHTILWREFFIFSIIFLWIFWLNQNHQRVPIPPATNQN